VIGILDILLLSVHLLAVNVAAGGPIVAAWLDWRGTRGDEAAARAARWLADWSLAGLLGGAVLGVAVGWLRWDAAYRALWLGPMSYKLHWAGIEAVFSLVLMILWWLWLPRQSGAGRGASIVRGLLALLASTNLLYHFPTMFSVAGRLYDAGQASGGRIGPSEFRALMAQAETPAVAVHFVLASVAVAGVMLLGPALRALRRGNDDEAAKLARWGGRWALAPSLLQLPVGLWALATLPAAAQARIMGSDTTGTLLLIAALVAAVWLMRELAGVAMGEVARPVLIRTMAAMLITIVLMTAMQQASRL
jgi:hypothetical protein